MDPLLAKVVELAGYPIGAALDLLLLATVASQRKIGLAARFVTVGLLGSAVWRGANAMAVFYQVSTARSDGTFLSSLHTLSLAGLWVALPAAAAFVFSLRRERRRMRPRFQLFFAAAWLLVLLAASDPTARVVASLAPTACLAWYIYRYSLLGIYLSRRALDALALGVVFAAYLFAVRLLAGLLESELDAVGPLVEIGLIFAVALMWLPLYLRIHNALQRRNRVYIDFSRRLIEDAARILDLDRRLQFIAGQLGATFGLSRVVLIATGGRGAHGVYGERADASLPELPRLEALLAGTRPEMEHVDRSEEAEVRELLDRWGFHYVFPLSYEGRLEGVLLLDTSPRRFLGDDEVALLPLASQISHSIETCRIIEDKIGLEKALVRQEHLATLGKVSATIAHEIKNPLSSIKTLAQLMREDAEVEARYGRDLRFIVGETDRLNRSVQQLLSFSRPVPEPEGPLDLSQFLKEMGELFAREYASTGIRFACRVEPGLTIPRASPEALRQILLNLILNAVQACGEAGSVTIAAAHAEGGVEVSVTDTGAGIAPELRERIFEPFFTTKQKGTGLGLAIVRKNVRNLGGEIRMESPAADGRGTSVRIVLPVQ